ncbi:MAG: transcription antitermination factor NusB [Elusimicrobiales bacterium]
MGTRRLAREYCLQSLYLADCGLPQPDLPASLSDSPAVKDAKTLEFGKTLSEGVLSSLPELDAVIEKAAENWRISRMPAVDRAILRMAVYELLRSETPPLAVIDEAIELAKNYSTDDSGAFVNGILDRIRREHNPSDEPRKPD